MNRWHRTTSLLTALLVLVLLHALLLGATKTSAQATEWRETSTPRFAFLYTADDRDELALVLEDVDVLYDGLAAVFETELDEPIGVRLHPSLESYLRANPLVVEADGVLAGTRRGRSEIELIVPVARLAGPEGLRNAMRREMARLLAAEATRGEMPEGLLQGIGMYMGVPDESMAPGVVRLRESWSRDGIAGVAGLASPAAVYSDPAVAQAESRALIQFLVDARGFGSVMTWLHAMGETGGWREAMEEAFGTPPEVLQASFESWLPSYMDGGWRNHALYSGDITALERMVERGDYDAAEAHIGAVRALAEGTRPELAHAAEALLQRSSTGRLAGEKISAAMSALAAGEYAAAVGAAQAANQSYGALNDTKGESMASEVERRARLGLQAHRDLERARGMPAWRAMDARVLASDSAAAFAAIGNDARREEALSQASRIDRRLVPAAWLLVALGIVVLAWNVRQRIAERRSEYSPHRGAGAMDVAAGPAPSDRASRSP